MVLVDTSVWVAHLSRGATDLARRLEGNEVFTHPFIFGELSLGALVRRSETLLLLADLPKAQRAGDEEVFALIEGSRLYSQGIGWVDAHLLASARLSECSLWTLDRALARVAGTLRIPVEK
ncbi:MAG: PIN domain-containing protein [Deltaproteobacteria bacterium]|nr:PIN domain-containing protein [Deltaproteobacteria bacterium]MBI3294109.1 PIN domain-containing protein [Deltaproteobacteria bacterium]